MIVCARHARAIRRVATKVTIYFNPDLDTHINMFVFGKHLNV